MIACNECGCKSKRVRLEIEQEKLGETVHDFVVLYVECTNCKVIWRKLRAQQIDWDLNQVKEVLKSIESL